ncbi:unnamed protein product [Blumeria hordei]|uniref:Exonuclease domain-containing protein n=1 Tax=Blumeria hordei TaxID=2867405 RepID=A0A383V258_BLUHO|nr:unnamed protein product [Blumeria hordei]
MDCEMCMTGESNFSLTRISIVSWDGSVLMDELVKPAEPITNYLTQYSGITENMLKNVTTSLSDIQEKLLQIIHSHTILIGHSLNSDLTALKITHPHIVDTAIIFPHPRGPPLKSSLKFLAQRYLNREIQKGHGATGPGAGHDSIEDAKTCLDLVKQKCEKGKAWGTFEAYGENIFKRVARTGKKFKCQQGLPTAQSSAGRTSAAVDWGDPRKGPGAAADFPISCTSDDEVMRGVIRAVTGDPDGKEIPGGGVDFVWARFRELEALRGWSNNNRRATIGALGSDCVTSDIPIKSDEQTSVPATTAVSEALDIPLSALTKPSAHAIAEMTQRIFDIYSALPPCTAVILYSGSGCPLEMSRLQALHTTFKREYKTKKWDQLSVRWTDVEEQALRRASLVARHGLGFVGVK